MSLTAPGIKGVVTDFTDATPSATVAFQAVSAPASKNPDISFFRYPKESILGKRSANVLLSHFAPFFGFAIHTLDKSVFDIPLLFIYIAVAAIWLHIQFPP